ncbi:MULTISPECIES: SMP-30/gluconolactonase/LRE family protein [unclassified Mesorhizobium]|uniref:SMP-30/gluconolactonase/LRE family protein n=1 Tax=unclassified Mesorhizobium TaxID=325217 RepID=UPI000F76555C|nr:MULTISPECIES: SMP-30/gluconolactonase/LRE family protein [unclassified Mesorhizobium]AZO70415.1 SMP-30/gluconolactonase/LRE family protein [Mesorhizobium sp. M1D.F.Ca.ET.043.01.1.1]RWA88041.1 MAG: SMP-30/gluconolactonase/LRE family protein [Mesorhizobium sp.]RWE13449.1 MAG: SMP-30/gluconolactonase/LRE family protein [Mesorhizobium sp.]
MKETEAGLIFDARDVVGESLVWDERRGRLVWVDIIGRRIHGLDPASGAHECWATPDLVTAVGLRSDGGAIVGLRKEIALWDFGGPFRTLATIEADRPGTRLNEGVVAPDGSFWVGTMANNIGPDDAPAAITSDEGQLYRVGSDGDVRRLGEERFGITNTMVWLPDGRFVTADTMKNALYSYGWDDRAGRLGQAFPFFAGFERGLPDGSCLDAEGHVWNCRVVGGSCLVRIAPDGRLDRIVELPCSWPTSCAFGGADLDTLFVTSARFTMSAEHLAAYPFEGGLFALRPGVRGMPANRFG